MTAGFWGFLGSCGFAPPRERGPMWVQSTAELFPREIPGFSEDLLAELKEPGGPLQEKIAHVIDSLSQSARRLEGLQQALRRRSVETNFAGMKNTPPEVLKVVEEGSYTDAFLARFAGQRFVLHSEEVSPYHTLMLALEVHTGGAYWAGMASPGDTTVLHRIEMVGAAEPTQAGAFGGPEPNSAQRGAVLVWRWCFNPDRGPYELPGWLTSALSVEGSDPIAKMRAELEAVRRWELNIQQSTAQCLKEAKDVRDPYIREVLRLWPSELDSHGCSQPKLCAWVEGLDAQLFVGHTVLVSSVNYDANHALALHATIARRHTDEPAKEGDPPYRLTLRWEWTSQGCLPAGDQPVVGGRATRLVTGEDAKV